MPSIRTGLAAALLSLTILPAPLRACFAEISLEDRLRGADLVVVGTLGPAAPGAKAPAGDSHRTPGAIAVTEVLKGDPALKSAPFLYEAERHHSASVVYAPGNSGIWILNKTPSGSYEAGYPGNLLAAGEKANIKAILAGVPKVAPPPKGAPRPKAPPPGKRKPRDKAPAPPAPGGMPLAGGWDVVRENGIVQVRDGTGKTIASVEKPDPLVDALVAACDGGDAKSVGDLLAKGANPNGFMRHANDPEHLRAVLAQPANVPFLDTIVQDGKTPLMAAAWRGREDIVKILLDAKADPDLRNVYGITPLIMAARCPKEVKENSAVVKMLLEADANPEATVALTGATALKDARVSGQEGIVKLLLEQGAKESPTPPGGKE